MAISYSRIGAYGESIIRDAVNARWCSGFKAD